jgi:hypothetical protein
MGMSHGLLSRATLISSAETRYRHHRNGTPMAGNKVEPKRVKLKRVELFLCHSHADKRFVRKLAGHLSRLGVYVWLDDWELAPGDSLHGVIGKALTSVGYVGVVLSPDSVTSHWVQAELDQALTRERSTGEKVAIPLLHRSVDVPPFLAGRLYVDFSKSYFVALVILAGFLNNLPTRSISEALLHQRPKSMEDVIGCLERAGWKGMRYMAAQDYEVLRGIFSRSGVDLKSDQFDVFLEDSGRRPKTLKPRVSRVTVRK